MPKRTDHVTSVGGLYVPQDDQIGQPATQVQASDMNELQEAVVRTVELTGAVPVPGDYDQFPAAVVSLARAQLEARGNLLINGNMEVWQRGEDRTFPPSDGLSSFCADRWHVTTDALAGTRVFKVAHAAISPVPGSESFLFWYQNNSNTHPDSILSQQVENVNTASGQNVLLKFWASYGNGSTNDCPYHFRVRQHFGTGGSPSADVVTDGPASIISIVAWTEYEQAIAVPSIAGKTLGTNGDHYVSFELVFTDGLVFRVAFDQFQVKIEDVASPFEYQTEAQVLAECQRYFSTSFVDGTKPGTTFADAGAMRSTQDILTGEPAGTQFMDVTGLDTRFPVIMRVLPTVIWWDPLNGVADQIFSSSVEAGGGASQTFLMVGINNDLGKSRTRTGVPRKSNNGAVTPYLGGGKKIHFYAHYTAEAEFLT